MKIHNSLIKSTTVAEKTDLWGNFIIAIWPERASIRNKQVLNEDAIFSINV